MRISLVWLLFLFTPFAWSQASTSLGGRVTDAAGAVIPGADIKLTRTTTGLSRSGKTNNSGEYQFSLLAPGRYELTVTSQGFATQKRTGIELLVSQPATINVVLSVASVSSDVTVSADIQPMLNTTDATLGIAFTQQQIVNLPSEARNVPDLLSLQPGITFIGRTDNNTGTTSNGNNGSDSRSGAINGGRSDQSNITLDGIDVNDINNGYAFTSVLRVSQDAVGEFRVTTSNPNAQDGRSSGAQVALVTRSGSNAFHGSVYAYNRNNLFHANDFFNKQTQLNNGQPNVPLKLIRNVFGASVGGPIKQQKAFFFLNYEGRRDTQGFTSNGTTVPTDSFRQGNLKYVCADSSDARCHPEGNLMVYTLSPADLKAMDPQGIGVNSAVLDLLKTYPAANNPTVGDKLNNEGYSFSYVTKRSYNAYTGRLDWDIKGNGKHTLFWRGNMQNDTEPDGPKFPGQPGSNTLLTNSKGFAAGYTELLSNSLVNNLAFGLTRQGYSNKGLLSGPYVTLQSITSLIPTTSSNSTIAPVYNLVDNLTWTKHNHNLAFGTNIRFIETRTSSNALSYSNATGTYQYLNPAKIAGGGGPFDPGAFSLPAVSSKYWGNYNGSLMGIAGIINVGNVTYNTTKDGSTLPVGAPVARDYRWNEYEFYAQDSWKALSTLTLTFGLRYSYLQVPAETSGTQVGVCRIVNDACAPGNFSLTDYVNQSGQLAAIGQSVSGAGELGFPLNGRYNGKPDYWTPEKTNFSPRFALAFSPNPSSGVWNKILGNGQSSIRAGYSLVFDHFGAAIVDNFVNEGSFGLATTLQTSAGALKIGDAPRFTGVNNVPQSLLPAPPKIGFPGIPVQSGPTSGAIYWSQDSAVKTPYAHVVDFSISRQIHNKASLELTYVGRFAHRLLEQEDVAMPTNLAAAGTTYFAAAAEMSKMARANDANGVDVSTVQPIAYWQQLFGALNGKDIGFGPGFTATQNIYQLYQQNIYNEANALYALDMADAATEAGINPDGAYPSNRFYHDQFSALYAWRSIGNSNYNALQATYRQQVGLGLQADFNYTYSKSLDSTSQAERLGSSGGINNAQIFNTWNPNQLYGPSDFDLRHQINANYIWKLPFGRGQRFAFSVGRLTDMLIGGWQTTGIVRWTSGLPFGVNNGSNYPTNYDIQGFATQIGKIPGGRGKLQQQFANPAAVLAAFDFTLPGGSGTRNPLRGDGFFQEDAGLEKAFSLTERLKVKAGIELFNVTNSVRFDAQSVSSSIGSPNNFGNATKLLTNPRLAQFHARVEF
ncbi:TonB-dependent receptor [Edaphobacter albus]|uniref:TonB-dependent receptor n=1 Tax=Edaphobacter sp. 4G125 TaxID=2763071 RepID=UPI001646BE48|nr:carboxypeptidase-like regulatory domain-containing protein [Edaphobacter sp. 4G125]QNI37155.1 carboxypeptidase regulatory-like domain-containing protein [Edaphobacter sp. 4G125]